jgi:hypothetical protein
MGLPNKLPFYRNLQARKEELQAYLVLLEDAMAEQQALQTEIQNLLANINQTLAEVNLEDLENDSYK